MSVIFGDLAYCSPRKKYSGDNVETKYYWSHESSDYDGIRGYVACETVAKEIRKFVA